MSRQIQHNRRRVPLRRTPPPEDPYLTEAKKITSLYFDTMDNKRDKLIHLYGSECRLIFDGNPYAGGESIQKFWQENFPLESIHTIRNQDYKNFGDTYLIMMTGGKVEFADGNHIFSQVITCRRQDGMWKIMSDEYRLLS